MISFPPRLLGVVLLTGSGCSTFVHRAVYEAARHGPARTLELGLALLTFMLASVGMMLLVNGAKLFEPPARDVVPCDASPPPAFELG